MRAQRILYRGAGLDVVCTRFTCQAVIGASLFALSLARFRQTLATMA
jgi:ABC-2 type transport system permease protein